MIPPKNSQLRTLHATYRYLLRSIESCENILPENVLLSLRHSEDRMSLCLGSLLPRVEISKEDKP